MKISVSMIARNEERNIGRALASCSFADEIVVVDDGDAALPEADARIVRVKNALRGNSGDLRRLSLQRCTGDWVVRLDADEVFSDEFERGIRDFLERIPGDVSACTIRQCNLVGSESFYSKTYDIPEEVPRIWRNRQGIRWDEREHERLAGIEGKVFFLDAYVVRYGLLDRNRGGKDGDHDIQPRPARAAVGRHVPPFASAAGSGRPRVAIVRGPNLNKWEMQNYEPLAGEFALTAYTTTTPNFDLEGIRFPVVKVPPHPEHPGYMVGLESALRDADLVCSADTTWIFSFQAAAIREKFGKRLVCLQWENIPFAYEEGVEMKGRKATVRSCADHFLAVTERAKEALVLEGVDPGRITVVPMGIDTERFRPDKALRDACRREFGISSDEKVVLFAGRMVWEKGVFDFVHAARLVASQAGGPPIRYLMVGKGPERDAVMGRVAELGLVASFRFVESHPYERMRDLYNAADVFVLPSISTRMWKEQFGMVLVEAMACGVPVISTSSGSIPEVVGDAGILVPANDPGDLSRAIDSLCRDNVLRAELGGRGRRRAVDRFDSAKVAGKLGRVFHEVLMREGDRRPAPMIRAVNVPPCGSPPRADAAEGGYYRQERRDVMALVPAGARRVLDVGCGEGILGKRLLEMGASEVVGMEIDPAVASCAGKNLSRVLVGDVESLEIPFDEGYFDCILLADVLEHLKDPLSCLVKLKRCLSDTGTIVASIPNVGFFDVLGRLAEGRWEYNEFGILDKTHLRFFTKKEIEILFRQAGLELTGITENLSPLYASLPAGHSGDVSFGRATLHGLTREEVKELFVFQYLLQSRKAEIGSRTRDRCVDAALESGDLDAARSTLEEYLAAHPLDADALIRHSGIALKLGRFEEALGDIDKVLLFNPAREDALELKAAIHGARHPEG